MTQTPRLKKEGASIYACTVCENFKVEITKPHKMNAAQLKKHIAAREVQHNEKYHSTKKKRHG